MNGITELTNQAAGERSFLIEGLEALSLFVRCLASYLEAGDVIALTGPLGAGKTELVRAFVRQLGGVDDVASPTFVLESVYPLPSERSEALPSVREVHHWDLYRLRGAGVPHELAELDGEPGSLTFVEWGRIVEGIDDLLCLELMLAFFDETPRSAQLGSSAGAESVAFVTSAESSGMAERVECESARQASQQHVSSGEQLSSGLFVDNGKRIITVRPLKRPLDLNQLATELLKR